MNEEAIKKRIKKMETTSKEKRAAYRSADGVYHASTLPHDFSARNCECEECNREKSLTADELDRRDYPDE